MDLIELPVREEMLRRLIEMNNGRRYAKLYLRLLDQLEGAKDERGAVTPAEFSLALTKAFLRCDAGADVVDLDTFMMWRREAKLESTLSRQIIKALVDDKTHCRMLRSEELRSRFFFAVMMWCTTAPVKILFQKQHPL